MAIFSSDLPTACKQWQSRGRIPLPRQTEENKREERRKTPLARPQPETRAKRFSPGFVTPNRRFVTSTQWKKTTSTTTTTKQENSDSRLVRACTRAHRAAQHIRHRPNCVPPGVRSSRRRRRRHRCRRAPWQCGGGGENLVVSAFGLSPGGADVKSGSVERARDGASCGTAAPAGVARHSGALAGPTPWGASRTAPWRKGAGPGGGGACAGRTPPPQCAAWRGPWGVWPAG